MAAPIPVSRQRVRHDQAAARGVAMALLAGPWDPPSMRRRATSALARDRPPRWMQRLVSQVLEIYPSPPSDGPRGLAEVVQSLPAWLAAEQSNRPPRVTHWVTEPTSMGTMPWPVVALPHLGALARLLDVDAGELAWFADLRGLERRVDVPLRHYRWTVLPKRTGVRLVAAPKPRLKEIQRRLLRHVLAPVPLHPLAHGGVPGRSVRTALEPHAAAHVVIRTDLEAFFTSIAVPRIYGVLRTAGYPEAVAYTISGLCTTVVPRAVWQAVRTPDDYSRHRRLGQLLAVPHLPQGAPTSPALANLVAFSLDRRLAGLARAFDANYTRYVDDLTFSGGGRLRAGRSAFLGAVADIAQDEGFRLVDAKTVVLGSAGRQQLLGAVINDHPTLSRRERDALRALLHNCAVLGWRSQARGRERFAEHVLGRIGHVAGLDPALGAKLRASYDAIDWSEHGGR
jgi:RNA-directed DNA polymerase